jgi:hypothetical protein
MNDANVVMAPLSHGILHLVNELSMRTQAHGLPLDVPSIPSRALAEEVRGKHQVLFGRAAMLESLGTVTVMCCTERNL